MKGVILIAYDKNSFEVEFVDADGYNYSYNGQYTFTIDESFIEKD